MLYGIRRDLQRSLVREGYRVRIYIPFGRQWFPYFMRRLGERPANVVFVLKGITSERTAWSTDSVVDGRQSMVDSHVDGR